LYALSRRCDRIFELVIPAYPLSFLEVGCQFFMPVRSSRRRPTPDRRRALELLASCRDGCTEALLRAHGFALVRAGLPSAAAERVVARPPLMRGVLIRSIVILGALVIGPLAQAEPVHLTCEGEMHLIDANGEAAEKYEYALSLAIDQRAGTATVDTYQAIAIPSKADSSGDTLMFMANPKPGSTTGVSGGTLNRRTGKTSIHIITGDGLRKFYGICQPAKRLF
jgi:hypothetical protein